LAKTTVEAAAPNVIMANIDNASFSYMATQPNNNPINENLVLSGRDDFVFANTLVDMMNGLNDPRRPLYMTQVDTSTESGVIKMAYVGGVPGASCNFANFSHVAAPILEPTFESLFFDAAEAHFLLAEGAARGFSVGGSAEEHYNAAISASIMYWGGTDAEAATYIAQAGVAYNSEDWKKSIGEQKWIALFNRGFEAWTAQRMLDHPFIVAPPTADTEYPVRLTYPTAEQTLNAANRSAAAAAIGGDDVTTRLFWDTEAQK
jgi:hypothetical protein